MGIGGLFVVRVHKHAGLAMSILLIKGAIRYSSLVCSDALSFTDIGWKIIGVRQMLNAHRRPLSFALLGICREMAVTNLFQLIILVTLTGVLVSVAAVSRLMEFTISFIHPMTIFMLRQSGKLVICLINQSAKLMTRTLDRMCKKEYRETTMKIGQRVPEDPSIVQETNPLANGERLDEVDIIVEPIETAPVEAKQENSSETTEVPEQVADDSV